MIGVSPSILLDQAVHLNLFCTVIPPISAKRCSSSPGLWTAGSSSSGDIKSRMCDLLRISNSKTFLLFYSWMLEFTTEKCSPHLPVQIKKPSPILMAETEQRSSKPWTCFYSQMQLQEQKAQQSVHLPKKYERVLNVKHWLNCCIVSGD